MNKVCIVTGASGDIGRSISFLFAKEGYDLVLCYYKNKSIAVSLKDEIESKYKVNVLTIGINISNEDEVIELKKKVLNKFKRIDVLINNAAVEISSEIKNKNYESFKKVLDVNVIGTFLMCKHIGSFMIENGFGKIVNVSSNNGINKYDPSTLEYDLSKAAIINMTKNLAKYFAPNVNINCVAPGWVKTDKIIKLDEELDNKFISSESEKILLKRFAEPEEIASLIYFLCSDKANYITGEIIKIDGGSNE